MDLASGNFDGAAITAAAASHMQQLNCISISNVVHDIVLGMLILGMLFIMSPSDVYWESSGILKLLVYKKSKCSFDGLNISWHCIILISMIAK